MSEPLIAIPGTGLVARPIAFADADEWFAFASLPQVKQLTSSTVSTIDDVRGTITRSKTGEPSAPIIFALRAAAGGRLVGAIGFHTVSAIHRTAEINYEVHPDFWRKGIATASCRAIVAWGFDALHLVRVQATTLEANLTSQRVLGKCGFVFEGKLRNFRLVQGVPRDYLLYATVPPNVGAPR
jgi:RimJ/RimL family protein N-acetyltransferase